MTPNKKYCSVCGERLIWENQKHTKYNEENGVKKTLQYLICPNGRDLFINKHQKTITEFRVMPSGKGRYQEIWRWADDPE